MSNSEQDRPRKVVKSDAEWRAQLNPLQYEVTRHAATERPFTGEYWDRFADGRYEIRLDTAFASVIRSCAEVRRPGLREFLLAEIARLEEQHGGGWPSYWAPINSEVIERVEDKSHGMTRVEVRCNHCGAHLGHVFEDGPQPTGKRFCINSCALELEPTSDG